MLDNESCLDWWNVRNGTSEMYEEETVVIGQVLMYGLQIALFGEFAKLQKATITLSCPSVRPSALGHKAGNAIYLIDC